MPELKSARVESLRATMSRKKNMTISSCARYSSSTWAWTSAAVRSSVGWTRRAALERDPGAY
jgi:hypothetical protein